MAGKKDPRTSDQQREERWIGSDREWDSRREKQERENLKSLAMVNAACTVWLQKRGIDLSDWEVTWDFAAWEEWSKLFSKTTNRIDKE